MSSDIKAFDKFCSVFKGALMERKMLMGHFKVKQGAGLGWVVLIFWNHSK